jgi:drug/metabolite transporter (DMT)-like permease
MTIPLTAFNILLDVSPFFTLFLTYFFLNEKITVFEMIAMLCSFGAVMLVALAAPENSLSVSEESAFYGWTSQQRYILGISCATVSALLFAIYITSARVLKQLHYSVIFCWGMIFDSTVTLLLAVGQMIVSSIKDESPWPFHFTSNWPWVELPASAILNVAATNLMTVCAQCQNPTLVQLLCYIKIVFCYTSDKIFFQGTFNTL